MKESLLQICYAYRNNKWGTTALGHIMSLMDIVANYDKNGAVLKFLLTIEGPAYTCHRYWDWIEPYVEDNAKLTTHDEETRLKFMAIESNIQKIKKERESWFGPIND
jgi:hypothetical protein